MIKEVAFVLGIGITLEHAANKHTQTNGMLARTNAYLSKSIKIETGKRRSIWHKYVDIAILFYNKTYHTSTACEQSSLSWTYSIQSSRLDSGQPSTKAIRSKVPHCSRCSRVSGNDCWSRSSKCNANLCQVQNLVKQRSQQFRIEWMVTSLRVTACSRSAGRYNSPHRFSFPWSLYFWKSFNNFFICYTKLISTKHIFFIEKNRDRLRLGNANPSYTPHHRIIGKSNPKRQSNTMIYTPEHESLSMKSLFFDNDRHRLHLASRRQLEIDIIMWKMKCLARPTEYQEVSHKLFPKKTGYLTEWLRVNT